MKTVFPTSSADVESACSAKDLGWIPELERSPGEEIGYPLQYSWASLVAQMVKNPSVVQKTWVQSLGWEDFLEEGMAAHSSISAWRIHMDTGAWQAIIHGVRKSRTWLVIKHSTAQHLSENILHGIISKSSILFNIGKYNMWYIIYIFIF